MLHLITGTPGSGKTLYAVYLIDKQEIANKQALDFNANQYAKNKKIIENNDLFGYFSTHIYFSKITKDYQTLYFDDNHFEYFQDKIRTENIFLDIKFYNDICQKIKDDTGIELKQLKYVRHIYANIDGLKVDNVREMQIDWRKCPDGSIIFYDEIQLLDEYSNDNKKDEQGIIRDLTIHRHRAFDIYGITQFPRLVNTGFRDVVGLHYHLHRGWGAKSATVYVWANCRDKPNSLGNKITAERDFKFNYPKRLYEVYESTTADTVKLRIPTKFILLLFIPFFGLILLFNTFFAENNFLSTVFGGGKPKQVNEQTSQTKIDDKKTISEKTLPSSNGQLPQDVEQLKQEIRQQITNELHQKYLAQYTLEVGNDDLIRPASIISYNGKCRAYNVYGDGLNMTKAQCEHLLANPHLIPKKRNTNNTGNPMMYHEQQQQINTQENTTRF